jgi:hypothetical protein
VAAARRVNRVGRALQRLAGDLTGLGKRWALVGGLAVSVRAEPRFTRDADVVVAVAGDPEAERLVADLVGRGYRVLAAVEQEATRRLATVRLSPPGEPEQGVVVDLLFATAGIEAEIAAAAEVIQAMPALRVPVATTGHLIALKVLSRDDRLRPFDRADLNALLAAADAAALASARAALQLILDRGFHRGRPLMEDFETLLAETGRRGAG